MMLIMMNIGHIINQWPFQEPKLEVPTIYKAYVHAYVREYNHEIWPKIWSSTFILGS
jgi:hypothetical protein